ncbi:MAG: response regulator, partial [Oscillatoria sp. PMC 1068.18]|nr:response regulator [Oscillatoria sp. PMC 1068.18]
MAHKILIVENNSEVRMRVIKMLPSGNYEILEAEDGEEALTQIRSQYPKFVFLNWKLPKINGWEVYQEMQTDQRLHKTAVVMMCRRQDEIAAKIPQAFKYFEYIERPFNKKQLVEAIKSATEKAKQPRSQTSPTTQPKPEPSPTPLAAESEDDAIKAGISSLESAFPQDVSPENLDLSASDFDFNPLEESSQTEPAAEVMANPFAQSEEAVSLSDSASEAATFNPFASTTEDLGMDSFEESGERDVETSDIFAVSPATFDEEEASEQVEVEENIIALGAVSEQAEVESEVSSNQEFDFEQDEAVSSNQEF